MTTTLTQQLELNGKTLPAQNARKRSLHVVIVDEELPYPLTSGKRIRTLNLVKHLAKKHRITFLCHANACEEETRAAEVHLQQHNIEAVVVPHRIPRKGGLAFYGRLFANLFSPLPYSVTSHDSDALRRAIADYGEKHDVDLWQCEWTPYAMFIEQQRQPHLINSQNAEAQIWQRYYATERNPIKRQYIKHQWTKFARFEERVLHRASRVVAVSDDDARFMKTHYRMEGVRVVENGVDTSYFGREEQTRNGNQILFVGSLDWRPNLDAVEQLLHCVFPEVRQECPSARLCLVGRNPPAGLRKAVRESPNVELHADVPDVRPFLASSGVMVVPLRIGGGSRIKILEALASGLPVISTRIGAEGLRLQPGRHLTVTQDTSDMANAVVNCLQHPQHYLAQADQSHAFVRQEYDWRRLATKLEYVWYECLTR